MTTKAPMFYQPVFGNDNFYAPDVIDIAAFTAPVMAAPVAGNTKPRKKSDSK